MKAAAAIVSGLLAVIAFVLIGEVRDRKFKEADEHRQRQAILDERIRRGQEEREQERRGQEHFDQWWAGRNGAPVSRQPANVPPQPFVVIRPLPTPRPTPNQAEELRAGADEWTAYRKALLAEVHTVHCSREQPCDLVIHSTAEQRARAYVATLKNS